MRSKLWKVIAVAMAAAMLACVSAGCAKNESKTQDSSAASVTSTESKAEESKADESKADESKADESKADESKEDESKADESKADESKADESKADESKPDESTPDESTEENSTEESAEGSEEESTEDSDVNTADFTAEDIVGNWEFNVGDSYSGLILGEDGSAVARYINGFSLGGTWELNDGVIAVKIAGGVQNFTFADGKLVDNNGLEMLRVESLGVEDKTDEIVAQAAVTGSWVCETENGVVTVKLEEGGTGTYSVGDTTFTATWEVENGGLDLHVEGGLQRLVVGISSDTNIVFVDSETGLPFNQVQ